jgi:UDP-glucuronate decarboxylase
MDKIVCEDIISVLDVMESQGLRDVFMGKRFLISGGSGFLGSWLADILYAMGAEKITIVDNLSTGNLDNIKHLLNTGKVELIKKPVEELAPLRGYDYVLHLAARPSPDDYTENPVDTLRVSSIGTYVMLETARINDAVFLLTSTSEIYGHAEVIPTPEDYWGYVNPIGPRSCYDEGKRFAEALTMAYMRQYGLDVRISRIFNTYGPRLDVKNPKYGRVIVKFILQALKGEPLTIYGDGSQTRTFLYVSDCIDAHLRLLAPDPKLKGVVINVGGLEEIAIIDLARKIKKLTNSSSELLFLPPRPDDPPRRKPDISKAKDLLGWQPYTPLDIGLRKTISWIKNKFKL